MAGKQSEQTQPVQNHQSPPPLYLATAGRGVPLLPTTSDVSTPPSWTSYTWWLGLVPTIAGVVGFFLHKQVDLTPIAGAIALIGSSVAVGAIAISRAIRHKATLEANTQRAWLRHQQYSEWLEKQYVPTNYAAHEDVGRAFDRVQADLDRLRTEVTALKPKPPAPRKRATARKTAPARSRRR